VAYIIAEEIIQLLAMLGFRVFELRFQYLLDPFSNIVIFQWKMNN